MMLFSDLYKSPRSPLSKLRNSLPQHSPPASPPNYNADLVSKDKAKQKEAVKRHLAERVRNDWEFPWPPSPPDALEVPSPRGENLSSDPATNPSGPTTAAHLDADTPQPCPQLDASVDGTPATVDQRGEAAPPPGPVEALDEAAPEQGRGDVVESETESETGCDSGSDVESVYTTVSEDASNFRSRAEWISELSDEDLPRTGASPFRFDTPDAVGTVVRSAILTRKAKRRRALREETTWNDGLACFTARRDAWTGARTVRVKPKPPSPASPSPSRRFFWRSHTRTGSTSSSAATTPAPLSTSAPAPSLTSPLSPATTRHSHNSQPPSDATPPDSTPPSSEPDPAPVPDRRRRRRQDSRLLYPVEDVVPVPPPLIPAENPMRASIAPNIYPSLYDKVVVNGLHPSCPINLGDMVRACVVGWKRDGEWPPRPSEPLFSTTAATAAAAAAAAVVVVRRRKDNGNGNGNGNGKPLSTPTAAPAAPAPPTASPVAVAAAVPATPSRRGSAATNGGGSRRMSLVGLLDRVGLDKERDKDREKENKEKENNKERDGDERPGSAAGKAIRRSLHKVFSLGHSHGHGDAATNPAASKLSSPTSPDCKLEERVGVN